MSWESKAIVAWGWLLTNEEVSSLPQEVYDDWIDNEWLILSADKNISIFSYYTAKAEREPVNVSKIPLKNDDEQIAHEIMIDRKVDAFRQQFPARADEPSNAYLFQIWV